jgi:phage head maturation protease
VSGLPYWELGEDRPTWYLEESQPAVKQPRAPIFRTVSASPTLIERAVAEGTPSVLNMKFAVFDHWQEINDPYEGRFLERISRTAFAKSVRENLANVKALLSHGRDSSLGAIVLGRIEAITEEADAAVARVSLFPSVPPLLVDGLKAGVYGASFRGDPIKSHIVSRPGRSPHNPEGLPEVTRTEIRLKDVGPTASPAYAGTLATIGGT